MDAKFWPYQPKLSKKLTWQRFSNLQLSIYSLCSLVLLFLAEKSETRCDLMLQPSCSLKYFSAHHGWKECLSYYSLLVCSKQSGNSALTSLINKEFLPTDVVLSGWFCFSLYPMQDCCVWKSDVWTLAWTFTESLDQYLHDIIQRAAVPWLEQLVHMVFLIKWQESKLK